MIALSLAALATIVGAQECVSATHAESVKIHDVVIDSNKVKTGCLFVALKGQRFDGHDFAAEAVKKGAVALLVERSLALAVPQLIVRDTKVALGQLSAWVRQQSSARVVALTGSSGKTSVKEMTAAILRQCGEVLYTEGNFNNDIGVPLTLLRLTPAHQYAVIELGANHIGEIAYTAKWVQPEAALVNNLSAAHLQGFGSLAGVAKAKGEIFDHLAEGGRAIINAQSHDCTQWQAALAQHALWRFSADMNQASDFYATDVTSSAQGVRFLMHTPIGCVAICLPLFGQHNVANALAAAALSLSVGATLPQIVAGLAHVMAVPGRLFPIHLSATKLLLDDSYNANVGSMLAAIATLAEMPGYRVLVVGDMAELGKTEVECHQEVGRAAQQAQIDCVLSVGVHSQQISAYSKKGEHFSHNSLLMNTLFQILAAHEVITVLVKGSRSAGMEQVVYGLQERLLC